MASRKSKRIDYNYVVQDVTMLLASMVFGIIVTPWLKEILTQGELKEDPYYLVLWILILLALIWLHLAVKLGALKFGR